VADRDATPLRDGKHGDAPSGLGGGVAHRGLGCARDYGVVAAGEGLLDSDFDSGFADEESPPLFELSDEADALVLLSLVADSDFVESVLASVASEGFELVPFL